MSTKFIKFVLVWGIFLSTNAFSQNTHFNISLVPIEIEGLGGLQSYAFGQHEGKWLIVGGRLDGLHRRQPFASFNEAGNNTSLLVIDPLRKQKWSAPLSSLPKELQAHLSSTNMQFYQTGAYLYVLGGYGYSALSNDHTTFKNLTAIHVQSVIEAIIQGKPFSEYFRQVADDRFQVTGGRLGKINQTYYLVGGQKFLGRYNPMGATHGPGFIQKYTEQIRKFTLIEDGKQLKINHLTSLTDTNQLHRRDYNVMPQILPTGAEGLTAFSGVFQKNIDLPFLNPVHIDSTGYRVDSAFTQYYNHYHCANFGMYSAKSNEMHNLFFGGIAQYYDSLGTLVQDNDVPFVRTIARVSRDAQGMMREYKLPLEMPALMGAGAELIPHENIPTYPNGVVKYDELTSDTTLIGYIYGGINSSRRNIFWVNNGTQSSASSRIFKVLLTKNTSQTPHTLNEQSIGSLKMVVYSSIKHGKFLVKYHLKKASDVKISIYAHDGKKISKVILKNQPAGENSFSKELKNITKGKGYILSIETNLEKATQKIIISL